MQTLFAPAVALMNRLRYRSKFLLLGMALVCAAVSEWVWRLSLRHYTSASS